MRAAQSLIVSMATLGIFAGTTHAYLGSFGPNDGYQAMYGTVLGDVTYNNAGQNGANAGGGAWQSIPADSGLWKLMTPSNGGVFNNAANRAAFAASYPSYNPTPANTAPIYLLGGHFPGHNNDGYNLAFRNDTASGSGAAQYGYSLDTFDFGGVSPASVTSGTVSMQFYFMPNPADPSNASGGPPDNKFTMSIGDGTNVGFEWGYARDNTVMWRDNPSNPWNYSAFVAPSNAWDGVKYTIDLSNGKFGIDYYTVSNNTWNVLVPLGTLMGTGMNNFTKIDWKLADDVHGGVGGKNYFDDAGFSVPEPGSVGALIGAAIASTMRRRRR